MLFATKLNKGAIWKCRFTNARSEGCKNPALRRAYYHYWAAVPLTVKVCQKHYDKIAAGESEKFSVDGERPQKRGE